MDNIIKNINKEMIKKVILSLMLVILVSEVQAHAAPSIDTLTAMLSSYTQKAGGIIAFIGAVMAALGFKNDDPSEMTKGIKTCIAGIFVFAIATGYQVWM